MEIPGDIFKPFLGLVNQASLRPVGRLCPWKMTRTTLDLESDKVDTPNNAVPTFKTSIEAKRGGSGKVEQASFDPVFNIYGLDPFGAGLLGTAIILREGMRFRMMCVPDTTVPDPAGLGMVLGVPILGTGLVPFFPPTAELPIAIPVNTYIFLALRVSKIHHMADCAAGQPFDFDFETIHAYRTPGESMNQLSAYGFSTVVNAGGNGGFF